MRSAVRVLEALAAGTVVCAAFALTAAEADVIQAGTQELPACDATADHRARFVGLPERVPFGTQEPFKVRITQDIGYFVQLDRGDAPAVVTISFSSAMPTPDGGSAPCRGLVTRTVSGERPMRMTTPLAVAHIRRVVRQRLGPVITLQLAQCRRLRPTAMRCHWGAGGDSEVYDARGTVSLGDGRVRSAFTGARLRVLTDAGLPIRPPTVLKRFRWSTTTRV